MNLNFQYFNEEACGTRGVSLLVGYTKKLDQDLPTKNMREVVKSCHFTRQHKNLI